MVPIETHDQQQAYEKFKALKCGALFMRPGTGKTRVALKLVSSKQDKVDAILYPYPMPLP